MVASDHGFACRSTAPQRIEYWKKDDTGETTAARVALQVRSGAVWRCVAVRCLALRCAVHASRSINAMRLFDLYEETHPSGVLASYRREAEQW